MKLYKKIMFCGALLATAAAFTSCSDDETFDVDGINYERVYVQNASDVKNSSLLKTPVGLVGGLKGEIAIQTTAVVKSPVKVKLELDNSQAMADAFNAANGKSCKPMPEGLFALSSNIVTIAANDAVSDVAEVEMVAETVSDMIADESYVIGVTIKEIDNNEVQVARDAIYRTKYFVLNYKETESLLLTQGSEDDLIGTPSDAASTWTCIEAANLDKDSYGDLFAGRWGGEWSYLSKDAPETYFIVDLGDVHNVSGFMLDAACSLGGELSLSTDNSEWLKVGSTKEAKGIYDSNWNTWYGMYAGLPARYVRVDIELDPNSWYWAYIQWGYCVVSGFNLRFDD